MKLTLNGVMLNFPKFYSPLESSLDLTTVHETSEEEMFLNNLNFSLPSDEEWRQTQEEDAELKYLIIFLEENKLPKNSNLALEILKIASHYSISKERKVLCYTSDTESPHYRLCVPKVFRRIVLQECHDSL